MSKIIYTKSEKELLSLARKKDKEQGNNSKTIRSWVYLVKDLIRYQRKLGIKDFDPSLAYFDGDSKGTALVMQEQKRRK